MQYYIDLKVESDMFQEFARFAQQLYKLTVCKRQSLKINF